jgi:hypothetical protein
MSIESDDKPVLSRYPDLIAAPLGEFHAQVTKSLYIGTKDSKGLRKEWFYE